MLIHVTWQKFGERIVDDVKDDKKNCLEFRSTAEQGYVQPGYRIYHKKCVDFLFNISRLWNKQRCRWKKSSIITFNTTMGSVDYVKDEWKVYTYFVV